MLVTLTMCWTLTLAGAPVVQSVCQQVAPANDKWTRSENRTRAVVLVHGYYYHLSDRNVAKALHRPWQQPNSPLVKELAKDADVFAFAYGQNATIDAIVKESKLASSVADLRKLGYSDIVLVGHSAGGLIARHFVEDNPDAGVTKVILVCVPNDGSPLASLSGAKSQQVFLECLTPEHRKKCLEERAKKRIPDKVQFACVIACTEKGSETDGVVPCLSQWSGDLRKQGIPAVLVVGGHRDVVREAELAKTVGTLVRDKQERWSDKQVEQARKEIFGK